jgi:hypothetical protein
MFPVMTKILRLEMGGYKVQKFANIKVKNYSIFMSKIRRY